MKKLYILAFSLVLIFHLSNTAFSQAKFSIKGGFDLMGESDLDLPGSDPGDVENGFSIGGEVTTPMSEQLMLGGGIVYQLQRAIDEEGWDDWKFNYVPIYGLIRYNFVAESVTPFVSANIGYGLLFADTPVDDLETEGGLYWGFGGGVIFKNNIFIEGLYTTNNGTISSDDLDAEADHTYTKISIFVGYMF